MHTLQEGTPLMRGVPSHRCVARREQGGRSSPTSARDQIPRTGGCNPVTRVSDMGGGTVDLTAETDYVRLVEVLEFNSLEISSDCGHLNHLNISSITSIFPRSIPSNL